MLPTVRACTCSLWVHFSRPRLSSGNTQHCVCACVCACARVRCRARSYAGWGHVVCVCMRCAVRSTNRAIYTGTRKRKHNARRLCLSVCTLRSPNVLTDFFSVLSFVYHVDNSSGKYSYGLSRFTYLIHVESTRTNAKASQARLQA